MAINYDGIESAIKGIGAIIDNHEFLRCFLDAFNFPKATYARLVWPGSGVRSGIYVQNKIFFVDTSSPNLYADYEVFKRNGLNRIHSDFLILANKSDILACDLHSLDIISERKCELYKHIEFFFPLLGIPTNFGFSENASVDIKVAEKYAHLYNEI